MWSRLVIILSEAVCIVSYKAVCLMPMLNNNCVHSLIRYIHFLSTWTMLSICTKKHLTKYIRMKSTAHFGIKIIQSLQSFQSIYNCKFTYSNHTFACNNIGHIFCVFELSFWKTRSGYSTSLYCCTLKTNVLYYLWLEFSWLVIWRKVTIRPLIMGIPLKIIYPIIQ